MMPALIKSAALRGIEAIPLDIEVDVLAGLPSYTVVGMGDKAIQESKERLTSAMTNIGFVPPRRKTIVSLAPASLKKEGSLYDVPIALGYLIASKQVQIERGKLEGAWFVGELGLDGTVRPINGLLPIALAAVNKRVTKLFIPKENSRELAGVADKIKVFPVSSMQQLVSYLTSEEKDGVILPLKLDSRKNRQLVPDVDFRDIRGQEQAKRALLIAAASSHNVLMVGPPGTGKTILARALAGILPELSYAESLTVTSLYSVAGLLKPNQGLMKKRPFRSPHHGASSVALVGGGANPKPGEVSLAHTGVLFLDELPEFSSHVLDQLRQPIEDGYITVSRAAHTLKFPSRSQLVGAMNPCKCGYAGSDSKECQCTPGEILRYQRRVSGPLLDRFDLHVLVSDVPIEELLQEGAGGMTSKEMGEEALQARDKAINRQGKTNSELGVKEVKEICVVNEVVKKLLIQAEQRFHLSPRGVHRLLKVARTIADLDEASDIGTNHVAEALQYREQLQAVLPEFV